MRKRNACGTDGRANDGPRSASSGSETSSAVSTRADAGAREALAAEEHGRRERDHDEQAEAASGLAGGRRGDRGGEDGAAAEQRGVGGVRPPLRGG